jgi:hypothetical protein
MKISVGLRFGKLTVLEMDGKRGARIFWRCLCDCGRLHAVSTSNLKSGGVRSCGCLIKDIGQITGAKMKFTETELQASFWRRVGKSDGCWNWLGPVTNKGYGRVYGGRLGQKGMLAHRFSLELLRGVPIPDESFVLHACDNRTCVKPEHLRIGNHRENMADMLLRGRSRNNISQECVARIREARLFGATMTVLADVHGVSSSSIARYCAGQRRTFA